MVVQLFSAVELGFFARHSHGTAAVIRSKVYHPDQVYPEYLVLYERLHGTRPPEPPPKDMPFLLELPLYWKNVGKNPRIQDSKTISFPRAVQAGSSSQNPRTLGMPHSFLFWNLARKQDGKQGFTACICFSICFL